MDLTDFKTYISFVKVAQAGVHSLIFNVCNKIADRLFYYQSHHNETQNTVMNVKTLTIASCRFIKRRVFPLHLCR